MNENNELLTCVYQNADMEVKSLTSLLKDIKEKDNKLKDLISEEIKGFEQYLKESEKLLKKSKVEVKGKGFIAETMAKMGIKKEVSNDNSDSAIAEMVIEGFTMGNLELDKLITNYEKIVDKKNLKLASRLRDFTNNEIVKLKKFI